MNVQIIIAPNGERLAVLPEAEYEALVAAAEDAADREAVRAFRAALDRGSEERVPADIADRLIDGESPARVWRTFRGLTMAELAARCGLSQGYVSQIESGSRTPSPTARAALAAALEVEADDLLP